MTERVFTVEEARTLLPDVEPLVQALHDAHEVMDERQEDVMGSIPTNGGGPVHRAFLEATLSAASSLSALDEMGVIVRDPSTGLIDFPSERDGEAIFLCWKLGEDGIDWWHPQDTGFMGRMPL